MASVAQNDSAHMTEDHHKELIGSPGKFRYTCIVYLEKINSLE
jgi:hypothetical protein